MQKKKQFYPVTAVEQDDAAAQSNLGEMPAPSLPPYNAFARHRYMRDQDPCPNWTKPARQV